MKAPIVYMEKVAYTAKEVSEMVIPGSKYPFSYLTGEIKELIQAIKAKDKDNIKEEKADVLYAAQMLLHQNTGLNFKMRGADQTIDKFMQRREMWKDIMGRYGVEYHPNLLVGGGNYRKQSKIRAALKAGGYDISEQELSSLGPLVGGFENEAAL